MRVKTNRLYTGCALDESARTAAEVFADRLTWFALGAAVLYFAAVFLGAM